MNQVNSKSFRILAIALSTRGFGYAVMEGENTFVDYGVKVVKGDKNVQSLAKVDKLINYFQPDILVLQDVNAKAAHRATRIKNLHKQIITMAKARKLKITTFSGAQIRSQILNNPRGTKHEMAAALAEEFPDELASRLPPKRKPWKSEDARMDVFEAVGLTVTLRIEEERMING